MQDIFRLELFHTKDFTVTVGSLILALAVILINIVLIKLISSVIFRRVSKLNITDGRTYAIVQLIKYILWIVAIVISLQVMHIDITFIIASSAALLVGLGLGMQIIFKDFMSGILLLIEGTIKVNDIVEIQDQVLKVKEISLRTSRVITREDNIVIIPNHKFIEENVINWSHNYAPTRFTVDVGVEYTSDIDLVSNCLLQALIENPDIVKSDKYKPFVRFNNFGDSALEFQLIFWSHNLFRIETTKSNIRYDIAKLFRANKITIPFTQLVLHQKDK